MARKTPGEQPGTATMTFDEAKAMHASKAAGADQPAEREAKSDGVPQATEPEAQPEPDASSKAPEAEAATPADPPRAEPKEAPPPQGAQRQPLPFYPTNSDEMWRYAQMLARSKLLPKAFYPKGDWNKENCRVADVHVVLMKGHDLGLKPMQAIGNINVIDGKAEVGALLMVSLILKSGLCEEWRLLHSDARRAVYRTKRVGQAPIDFEYTIEEAEQMGLPDRGKDEEARAKNQWRLQPRTMLRRRCQSHLAREVYPDVTMGLYDHDELAEMRAREMALGIDPDQVIDGAAVQPALPETSAGPIEQIVNSNLKRIDPLKQRLAERRAAQASADAVGGRVVRCSLCDSPLDPRDSDPCIACRTEAPALDKSSSTGGGS